MKNLSRILAVLILVFTISSTSFAQGKSEIKSKKVKKQINVLEQKSNKIDQKEKLKENRKKVKLKKDKEDDFLKSEKKVKKEKSNNGNAYGREKGDMSGREFGEFRSLEAKEKIKRTLDHLNDKEEILLNGRERVKKAKEKVLQMSKEKDVNDDYIKQEEEKIKKAENKLNELEETIKRGKEEIRKQSEVLENIQK